MMSEVEIQEARVLAVAAPILMPLIAKRKKIALDIILQKHRDGGNYVAQVAALDVLTELEREITIKEQMLQNLGRDKK